MRERVESQEGKERGERPTRGASPPPSPAWVLALQRTAGNQAVCRTLELNGKVTLSLAYFRSDRAALEAKLDLEFDAWAKTKKSLTEETKTAIKDLVRTWILDAEPHTRRGKKFMSYANVFDTAKSQVGPARAAPPPDAMDVEIPEAAPFSPPASPMHAEAYDALGETPTTRYRRAASVERDGGHKRKREEYAGNDDDRRERRKRRRQARERLEPHLADIPHGRRAQDEAGTVPDAAEPYRFGPHALEIQGGSKHRMTASGGGGARTYDAMITDLLHSTAKSDHEVAATIRAIVQTGTVPTGTSDPTKALIAELLATIAGPEMSRASVALPTFAAAIHSVAEGELPFRDAFVGGAAIYLGANSGGSAALRGKIDSLTSKHDRNAMRRQNLRADAALKAWMLQFVPKGSAGPQVDDRLGELQSQMINNVMRFERSLRTS